MKLEDLCEVKNEAGIYYLHDDKNDKYFIGQSIRLKNKLEKYFSVKNVVSPIEIAINQIGIENFSFKILAYVKEDNYALQNKKLIELETNYIAEYNAEIPFGYNPKIVNNKVAKYLSSTLDFEIKEPYYFINTTSGSIFVSTSDDINYIILKENEKAEDYLQISTDSYHEYNIGLKKAIIKYMNSFLQLLKLK